MHLSAGKMTKTQVRLVLKACLAAGIKNILALRGDEKRENVTDFQHAIDLVRFTRQEFGSAFTIAVAGYPAGHPESRTEEDDLQRLKEKVDAGADFIITQMITSSEELQSFTKKCSYYRINVPIIPGLFIIQSYNSFERVIKICNINVPSHILEELKSQADENDEKTYGEQLAQNTLRGILETDCCPGVHFFTMNRISTIQKILTDIDQGLTYITAAIKALQT